jgi:hypothetical protein
MLSVIDRLKCPACQFCSSRHVRRLLFAAELLVSPLPRLGDPLSFASRPRQWLSDFRPLGRMKSIALFYSRSSIPTSLASFYFILFFLAILKVLSIYSQSELPRYHRDTDDQAGTWDCATWMPPWVAPLASCPSMSNHLHSITWNVDSPTMQRTSTGSAPRLQVACS